MLDWRTEKKTKFYAAGNPHELEQGFIKVGVVLNDCGCSDKIRLVKMDWRTEKKPSSQWQAILTN